MTWRARAEEDLREVYLFLGAESAPAAERFLDRVERAISSILEFPEAGAPFALSTRSTPEFRAWSVPGFSSYRVFYRKHSSEVEIVRVLHGARDLPRLLESGD